MPAAVKRGTGFVQQTMVTLAPVPSDQGKAKLTKLQKTVLAEARKRADAGHRFTEMKQLAELAGAKSSVPVTGLVAKGWLTTKAQEMVRVRGDALEASVCEHDTSQRNHADADLTLSDAQQRSLDHLVECIGEGFSVNLLHGVTGSGKTEVYLRVIEHVLQGGTTPNQGDRGTDPSPRREAAGDGPVGGESPSRPGAIVLVPEIALTPQMAARFLDRFEHVAVLHSGLTAAQRHDQWRRIRDGRAQVVVGARSAVFAPMPRVGVIVVDEEHDASYKQDQLPRYHARDVAVKRGQLLGVPVVLGSATPSLESYQNATVKRSYHLLQLPDRVRGSVLPKVEIVDMTHEPRRPGGQHLLSQRLEKQIGRTVQGGGQILLLLNRRGWANYIACPDHRCGWLMNCQYCDAMMVYHKESALPTGGVLRCHHCRAEQLLPDHCRYAGSGRPCLGWVRSGLRAKSPENFHR